MPNLFDTKWEAEQKLKADPGPLTSVPETAAVKSGCCTQCGRVRLCHMPRRLRQWVCRACIEQTHMWRTLLTQIEVERLGR